jgi:hypothetical protein
LEDLSFASNTDEQTEEVPVSEGDGDGEVELELASLYHRRPAEEATSEKSIHEQF